MRAVRRNNVTGNFTWIGSDGWSARALVSDGNEAEVEGTLSVLPRSDQVKGFDQYFLSLTPLNNKRNPWFIGKCSPISILNWLSARGKCMLNWKLLTRCQNFGSIISNAATRTVRLLRTIKTGNRYARAKKTYQVGALSLKRSWNSSAMPSKSSPWLFKTCTATCVAVNLVFVKKWFPLTESSFSNIYEMLVLSVSALRVVDVSSENAFMSPFVNSRFKWWELSIWRQWRWSSSL